MAQRWSQRAKADSSSLGFYLDEMGGIPLLPDGDVVRLASGLIDARRAIATSAQALPPSCRAIALAGDESGPALGAAWPLADVETFFRKLPRARSARIVAKLRAHKRALDQARDGLVRGNLRLVVHVARKYVNRGLPLIDLIQDGNIGLLRAVEKFEHERGNKFSTYAYWWVKQSIERGLAEKTRSIRVPVHVVGRMRQVGFASRDLTRRLGRKPSSGEIAAQLGMPVDSVERAMSVVREPSPLEHPPGDPTGLDLSQIDIKTVVNLDASYEAVRSNRDDYTYSLPRGVGEGLGDEFGLRGRFRVRPTNCISVIAMNSGGTGAGAALFRNNPSLRRAVNYVIDREAMVELSGKYTMVPHDQYLPRGFPGFRDIDAYPFRPDVARARELAQGHVPSAGPWKYYYGLAAPGPQRMELVRSYLAQIGVQIDPQGFRGFAIYDAAARRNSPHAFVTWGWCQQVSDPSAFINVLFYRGENSFSHFDDPAYNRRMERAARLTGDARLRAYARLEHDLVTKAAPLAAWGQPANQFFFSDSVDTRSFVYQPIYEAPPYNLLALK